MSVGTIVQLDPKLLRMAPNVRTDVKLTPEFVKSIKEHGIRVPISVVEREDGFDVIDGQRRTLAALDAGLESVDCFVQAPLGNDADRIVEQLVVNDNRASLSDVEQVEAVKQLELFGMTATAIAKKTGYTKATVDQVLVVAKSDAGAKAFEAPGVSLDQAARVAEAGLSEKELKGLLDRPGNFDHALQQIVRERDNAALTKSLEAEVAAAGVKLAAKPSKGDYYSTEKNKHLWLDGIVHKETDKEISLEEHASCPGHAAFVGPRGYNGSVEIHYLCTDPSKYSHRDADRQAPKQLTDADKAERAANSAAAKVWPGIVEVRQTWIREQLLTRKTLPAGWERVVAWVDFEEAGHGGSWEGGPFAAALLGLTDKGYNSSGLSKWVEKNPTKVAHALTALALAHIELSAGNAKSWKGWRARKIADYLNLLASWGYGLSELEQELAVGDKKATAAG